MRAKIYLFGDSITEQSFENGGWGASLANHFARTVICVYVCACFFLLLFFFYVNVMSWIWWLKADVVLRGYSGYNTRWAVKVMERVFPADGGDAPLAVTVFFGANDASLPDRCSGFQHVPFDEYKQNLLAIVAFLKVNRKIINCSLCRTWQPTHTHTHSTRLHTFTREHCVLRFGSGWVTEIWNGYVSLKFHNW